MTVQVVCVGSVNSLIRVILLRILETMRRNLSDVVCLTDSSDGIIDSRETATRRHSMLLLLSLLMSTVPKFVVCLLICFRPLVVMAGHCLYLFLYSLLYMQDFVLEMLYCFDFLLCMLS